MSPHTVLPSWALMAVTYAWAVPVRLDAAGPDVESDAHDVSASSIRTEARERGSDTLQSSTRAAAA